MTTSSDYDVAIIIIIKNDKKLSKYLGFPEVLQCTYLYKPSCTCVSIVDVCVNIRCLCKYI